MQENRRALKSSGGKWSRPTLITTKLTPHTAATSTTRATERAGMDRSIRAMTDQSK
jgi:hypothetical protein